MNRYNKERIGERRKMNCGEFATIIKYNAEKDIDVKFDSGYIAINKTYSNFKKGEIINPYYPTVCGIGYLGGATIKDKHGNTLDSYNTWRNMLDRCFNKKCCNYKNYGAIGVSVCDEWKNYSNFKKWFNDNYYTLEGEKVELDKDILIDGNKIYSPQTCVFVPSTINVLFKRYKRNNSLPRGVKKKGDKFTARIVKHKHEIYLGIYNTPQEAHSVYIKNRNLYLLELAEFYKTNIPNKLYKRLIEIAHTK